jgi:glycosyltransferase involved in cell wall biosynthesis
MWLAVLADASTGVTVVIPTRDRWRFLRTAIVSVLGQRPAVPRVIVVDDGSRDETPERLASVAHPAITMIRVPVSGGVSAARNRGLAEVTTEWVTFLDDDDVWRPDHLSQLLAAVARTGREASIAVAGSGSVVFDRHRRARSADRPPAARSVPAELYASNCLGSPSRVMLRTAVVRAVGGFDEDLAVVADWALYLRTVRPGNVAISAELSVGYMLHGANMHLAADRTIAELEELHARHGAAGAPGANAVWLATGFRRSGRGASSARWYLAAFRATRQPRLLLRAVAALLGERVLARIGLGRREAAVPGIEPWIAPLRAVDRLPADQVPWNAEPLIGARGTGPRP